jgi:hypothetical protein
MIAHQIEQGFIPALIDEYVMCGGLTTRQRLSNSEDRVEKSA